MLSKEEVFKKLNGRDVYWHFGYGKARWSKVVLDIKISLLRGLWAVSFVDRCLGKDIPKCERCKEIILEMPSYISNWPHCFECYDDYTIEIKNEHDYQDYDSECSDEN